MHPNGERRGIAQFVVARLVDDHTTEYELTIHWGPEQPRAPFVGRVVVGVPKASCSLGGPPSTVWGYQFACSVRLAHGRIVIAHPDTTPKPSRWTWREAR
jgi:hypothetical protein